MASSKASAPVHQSASKEKKQAPKLQLEIIPRGGTRSEKQRTERRVRLFVDEDTALAKIIKAADLVQQLDMHKDSGLERHVFSSILLHGVPRQLVDVPPSDRVDYASTAGLIGIGSCNHYWQASTAATVLAGLSVVTSFRLFSSASSSSSSSTKKRKNK